MKKLSIIIPIYNEVKTVDVLLGEVLKAKTQRYEKEIVIIDDGSYDGTREKLKKWEKKVKVIYLRKNSGKGTALREGFKQSKGEIILVQDADLEYSPNDYPKLLEPLDNPKVSIVYGSRFLGAHLSTMFVYELGNKLVTLLTNILFNTNITDMETGYKVFRRKILDEITLQAKRFDFEPELTAKVLKAGYQIYEVPISYYGRKFSEGKKLTWKDGMYAFWTLIKYRIM